MEVTYNEDKTLAFFDGFKFRRDAKTGYYLSTKPTFNGRRERLHVYVWRRNNGGIPDGWHIHHKDGDKNHNDLENLVCINGAAHLSYHSKARAVNDREKIIKNLIENVIPAAAAWHKSEEGKQWHKEHWRESLGHVKIKAFKCQCCGKPFVSLKAASKFCSNNCKTKARKNSGVDNEFRKCIICGKEFVCDKYVRKKTCSGECAAELQKSSKREKMRRSTCV